MDKNSPDIVTGFSRLDGYMNVLNRFGTSHDSSEAYEFAPEIQVSDMDLISHYEGNGLFSKIIDTPAEKSATRDFDLGISDKKTKSLVTDALEDLEWTATVAQAVKWSRLFGGAIIVMLIDDGGRLEDPVNWDAVKGIDELVLFERAVVEPDYHSMYHCGRRGGLDQVRSKFGRPEFFYVYSLYGSFTVHESRCLVFRNGTLPETTTQAEYRYWGLPEYIRIRRTLREAVTGHSIGIKMLEKSVQGIYKMKDLTEKLTIEGGEDAVYKRMEIIDMVRGFLNSIIIDMEGEDYSFQTFQVSGYQEVIESSCNILSAVSNIPQTILFGRSPSGENATGKSDMENWYNYLGQISDLQIKPNLQRLLDILFCGWLNTGKLQKEPMYKLTFKPFWNLSEDEQADLDLKKIQVQKARAEVAQMYIDMQVLDPQEVRDGLADSEEFNIEELLDDTEPSATSEPGDSIPLEGQPSVSQLTNGVYEGVGNGFKNNDGGPGSGNWGHTGRPGKVGGSASGTGGVQHRTGTRETGFSSKAKERVKAKASRSSSGGSGSGAGGSSSGSASSAKSEKESKTATYKHGYSETEEMALSSEDMAATYLMNHGVPFGTVMKYVNEGTAIEAAKGTIEAQYEKISQRFQQCPESQQKFMNMSPEEAQAFASKSYEGTIDKSLNTGSRTQHMVQTLGLNDKPKVVSREEFDGIASQSPSGKIYRGVVDNTSAGVSADEIVDMTVSGNLTFLGNGIHSDGIYFSTQKSTADGYAAGQQGRVMEACFSDSARTVDYDELMAQKSMSKITDTGTFALYSGYNAIKVRVSDNEDYLIALDRSCLVFCDSRTDSQDSSYHSINGEELGKTFNGFVVFKDNADQDVFDAPSQATGKGVGVLVVRDGKILTGLRRNEGTFCGPGGHIEYDETPEEAAIRETQEEFGITPTELIHIGGTSGAVKSYLPSEIYLCTEYDGTPKADGDEMQFAQFMEPGQVLALIDAGVAFPPFAESVKLLLQQLTPENTSGIKQS